MRNIDLYKRIVELEGEIIDLSREKHQIEIKLYELEKMMEEEKAMIFRKPFFYKENDSQPYCPKCWEADHKAIHLTGPFRDEGPPASYYCCQFKNSYSL